MCWSIAAIIAAATPQRSALISGRITSACRMWSPTSSAPRFDLLCEDDDDAKERARQPVEGQTIELWRGATLLAQFEPLH